jgi:uncharacterized protein
MTLEQSEDNNQLKSVRMVYLSPFIIITVNCLVAILFGKIIGKWAFIPIIFIEWCLFLFFIKKYSGPNQIKKWLSKPKENLGWLALSLLIGILPIPLFLQHYDLLTTWEIILPWILIAILNPFFEEFYWRGLLTDYTSKWNNWLSISIMSILFALNHFVFAINSDLFKGLPVFISTLIMGVIWAVVYKKTKSLRWTIFSHFLVDFLNLSVPSFLDMYKQGWQ